MLKRWTKKKVTPKNNTAAINEFIEKTKVNPVSAIPAILPVIIVRAWDASMPRAIPEIRDVDPIRMFSFIRIFRISLFSMPSTE